MAEFNPVQTIEDFRTLDDAEVLEGSVKNLGRYAANWNAFWPKRPSSTAALT